MRTGRGTKISKMMQIQDLGKVDEFWVENEYFGKVDELEDDSSEFDFEKELAGKKEKELDSFDEDFGQSSNGEEEGEEEQTEEVIANRVKFIEDDTKAEQPLNFGMKAGIKSNINKKKSVRSI